MRDLHRKILAIALPAIASNITTPLLGLVDSAITGHIGSPAYIGAIAVGGTMFSMLYWVLNFLRMGSGGLTAQAYGRGDAVAQAEVLWRGMLLALVLGLLLICVSPFAGAFLPRILDADADTGPLATRYFVILIWGAPAVLGNYVLSGWFLGMQNARAPMWMAILTNCVNILASMLLVFGAGWRIEGVATGSLVAQWAGLGLGLVLLRRYRPAALPLRRIIAGEGLKRYFAINSDIFLRTLCLVAVTLWFTRSGARTGVVTLAANALLMQLFYLFSYFMDGFAYAAEALGGKFHGAGDNHSLRRLISSLLRIGALLAVAVSAVYLLCGHALLDVLTDNQAVVAAAMAYLPWAALVPIAGVWAFVWDGIFIGQTRTRGMLASMAVAMTAFFVTYAITLPLGNHGLWLAFCVYLLLRGMVEWILYSRHRAA
ncbi:MAG: MATE family efflux transporter [Muribaculaceae bacterium]|nr:MATE family efflux transporter [Muribaculaceae bacterium]